MKIEDLMDKAFQSNASDVHLTVGKPPVFRIDGRLKPIDGPVLTAEDTEIIMKSLVTPVYQEKIEKSKGVNFGYNYKDVARFRVSIYQQRGKIGLSLRLLPYRMMSFAEIGLPPVMNDLLLQERGLILVTGPTGSGKTTTLASMINYILEKRNCHILTVEDPIEYYHEHHGGIMTQREIGIDIPSFSEAVMSGLRLDPDVILIGELRGLDTMLAALVAAETGHLVMATLHTIGAALTVDRIINAFPSENQEQVRIQMSNCLLAVISQVLVPCASGKGRVAAFELMVATTAIQSLIREKKTFRITSEIQTGKKAGMQTMEDSLFELYRKNIITKEEAMAKARDIDTLKEKIKA